MRKLLGFAMMGVGVILLIVTATTVFYANNAVSKVSEVSEELNGIDQISLASKAVNWTIIPVEGDELNISISGKDVRGIFDVERNGDSLKVETEKKGFKWFPSFFGEDKDRDAIVYLPVSYTGELKIDSVSGETLIEDDLSVEELDVEVVSGNFSNTGRLQADKIDFGGVSANFHLNNVVSDEVKAGTVSGNVSVKYEDQQKELSVSTVSGNVLVAAPELNANYDFETLSGTVSDQGTTISAREYSSTTGEGQYELNISTLSGDITFE